MRWRPRSYLSRLKARYRPEPATTLQWATAISTAILAAAAVVGFFFFVQPTYQIQVLQEEISKKKIELSELSAEKSLLLQSVHSLESELKTLGLARTVLSEEAEGLQKANARLRSENRLLSDTGEKLRETLTWYQHQPRTACKTDGCEQALLLYLRNEILRSLRFGMLMSGHFERSQWQNAAFDEYKKFQTANFLENLLAQHDARAIVERIARDNVPALDDADSSYPYPTVYRTMLLFNLLTSAANHSEELSEQCTIHNTEYGKFDVPDNAEFFDFLLALPKPVSNHIQCEQEAAKKFISEWAGEMENAIIDPDFDPTSENQK